ncbi:MAG: holin family protein [Alphaproteobacteria bacterium]|nr:holin family protein [Alphaproteobacteria bacterium]
MGTLLDIIPALSALLDRIIPDPVAREKAKLELLRGERAQDLEELKAALAADAAQTDINKTEAASADRFVAGWRPFIGWVCGVAFAYHFVLQPLLAFIIANGGGGPVELPKFDMDALSTVLMGMLGLGGLRTLEKIKKITR